MKAKILFILLVFTTLNLFGQGKLDILGQPANSSSAVTINPMGATKGPLVVVNTIPHPASFNQAADIAWDGTHLWCQALNNNFIYKVSPTDGTVVKTLTPSIVGIGLTFDGQDLWVSDQTTNNIYQIDTATGNVLNTYPVPTSNPTWCTGLAWDNTDLWLSDVKNGGASLTDSLFQITPSGTALSGITHPVKASIGLGFDGTHLWSSNNLLNILVRINPVTMMPVDTINAPAGFPNGIAFDGQYLWVASNGTDSLYQLDIGCVASMTSTTASGCDSYTVPSGNATYTYATAGTYMVKDTLTRWCGGDSIVTIDLTINVSSTATDVQAACDTYTWIDGNTYTASNNTATFTLPNATGCDSVVTLDLTITTIDTSVTQAGFMLTANQAGATYQWFNCDDNMAISGATNQSYTVTTSGNYAVVVTSNGCSDTSDCRMLIMTNTFEHNFGSELLVYPNPTSGNFSVDLGQVYSDINIKLTDITGKVVMEENYTQEQLLNFEVNQPAGVYLLMIQTDDKQGAVRLMVD